MTIVWFLLNAEFAYISKFIIIFDNLCIYIIFLYFFYIISYLKYYINFDIYEFMYIILIYFVYLYFNLYYYIFNYYFLYIPILLYQHVSITWCIHYWPYVWKCFIIAIIEDMCLCPGCLTGKGSSSMRFCIELINTLVLLNILTHTL